MVIYNAVRTSLIRVVFLSRIHTIYFNTFLNDNLQLGKGRAANKALNLIRGVNYIKKLMRFSQNSQWNSPKTIGNKLLVISAFIILF